MEAIAIQNRPASTEAQPALHVIARPMRVWMFVVVALLAIGVYANSLANGFALDDVAIVEGNPHVLTLDWTKIWADNYWPSPEGPPDILYRPLTIWSYLANQAIAPGAAWAFHAVNVALHAIVSLLVMVLAFRIFRSPAIAIITGILFAVHPIHTEVVANVVGRAELLAALWSLLALLVFLPTTDLTKLNNVKRHWMHGFIVAACFLLAMLSKETPVALVGALAFIDLWRWSQSAQRPRFFRYFGSQTLRYYLPVMLAFAIYMAMRLNGTSLLRDINGMHPIVNPLVQATPIERLFTPFVLLAKYMQLTVWPSTLSADYSAPSIMPNGNPLHPMVMAGMMMVLLGGMLAVATWKRRPQVALVVGLFVFAYVLVANYLRIGTIFGERLFYWPSVFVLMLASATVCWFWQYARQLRFGRTARVLTAVVMIAACIAMSVRSIERNRDWQNNIALAISTARDNPGSAKACYWAGMTLATQSQEPWMKNFGLELLHRAAELYPQYGESYWEIAKFYGREGKIDQSVQYLAEAARYRGGALEVRMALSAVKKDIANQPEAEMMASIDKHIAAKPEDPCRHLAKGIILVAYGRNEEAEKVFAHTLDLDPTFHEAAAEMAGARLNEGKTSEAVAMMRQYVMRVRYNVEARCQMAKALMMLDLSEYPGALQEAEMNLEKAEKLSDADSRVRALRAELNRKKAAATRSSASQVSSTVGPLFAAGR